MPNVKTKKITQLKLDTLECTHPETQYAVIQTPLIGESKEECRALFRCRQDAEVFAADLNGSFGEEGGYWVVAGTLINMTFKFAEGYSALLSEEEEES